MTTNEITARVEAIRAMVGDPEAAHAAEDKLRADFIRIVADMDGTASECATYRDRYEMMDQARLILSTDEIEFPRWTA